MGIGSFARVLIVLGVVVAVVGVLLLIGERFGLGHLPGDISIGKGRTRFYFPLVTSIVVSVALTIVLNLLLRR